MSRCRCYIIFKYYAHQAKIGGAGMKNYKPCPIHEVEESCPHTKTVAINEEGHAGVFCVDCEEKLEKEC